MDSKQIPNFALLGMMQEDLDLRNFLREYPHALPPMVSPYRGRPILMGTAGDPNMGTADMFYKSRFIAGVDPCKEDAEPIVSRIYFHPNLDANRG